MTRQQSIAASNLMMLWPSPQSLGQYHHYIEGVIIAMAEFIHFYTTTGEPDLDNWVPVSSMTKAELTLEIQRMEADQAALAEELSRPKQPSETAPEVVPSPYDNEFDEIAREFGEKYRKLRAKHGADAEVTA